MLLLGRYFNLRSCYSSNGLNGAMKRNKKGKSSMMKQRRLFLAGMLLLSLSLLAGCGIFKKEVRLYPISQSDIVMVKAGDNFTAPKDGAFLSELYITEVMEAKFK